MSSAAHAKDRKNTRRKNVVAIFPPPSCLAVRGTMPAARKTERAYRLLLQIAAVFLRMQKGADPQFPRGGVRR
jgi:hypothetical protein